MTVIGSLLLPSPPNPSGPPEARAGGAVAPAAGSADAWARAMPANTTRATARPARSGRRGIAPQHGADVVEQVDQLRSDVHLHALRVNVHVAARDGDRARGGDQVALAVVGGLVGAHLDLAQPQHDRSGEHDRRELLLP